jgi:hypothetical protein
MMRGFVQGADRQQTTLLPECLDDWVGESNPVRAVDVFVDALELCDLGFDGVETSGPAERPERSRGAHSIFTTALSRFRFLFVIARNSSFLYKARAVDMKQIGRELGVRYVLEGSVRKAGGRIRITGGSSTP